MRRLAPLLLALLLPACGHRGDPRPPLRKTPPGPQEFRLAQRGDTLELRALAPASSVDGVAFKALALEFLLAEGLNDLEKAGQRTVVPAVPGTRVATSLPLPAPGTTVRAAARAVSGREKGPRTLILALVVRAPIEAPSELAAALAEDGVALSWRGTVPKEMAPPALSPSSERPPLAPPFSSLRPTEKPGPEKVGPEGAGQVEGPRKSGFLVYRRVGGAGYGPPLEDEPTEGLSLRDTGVPAGATACYVVRAVASTNPLVESAPSNEVCVEVRDIAAPAPPAGLAVLPREGGLEVLWSPSAEADLAGYRVYRAEADGRSEKVAELELARTSWLDAAARPGVVYRYAVTALDRAGNESTPTDPVEASLP